VILTDTHTHIYSSEFNSDRDLVIKRANDAGVNRFFIPAIDSKYHKSMLKLEKKYANMFLMMGLHPTSVKKNYKKELDIVKNYLDNRHFYAIGEIGIDLYWDKSFLKEQQEVFKTQIKWAKQYKLPIVIHCREAFDEIFEILEEEKNNGLRGVFHCFTGNLEQAERAISYQMKLGIGGVVTFKNGKIDKFLNKIPLKDIVLETDSPYLAPTPNRGKRNESSYLTLVANKLSQIYNLGVEEIANITTQNSKQIFGI